MSEESLIPPPSIGASKDSAVKVKKAAGLSSGMKLGLLILACAIVGITLGVVVYQQSVTPKSTPRPSIKPQASPIIPQVSEVTPQTNSITFPKEGKIRVYVRSLTGSWKQLYFTLSNAGGSVDFSVPAGSTTGTQMSSVDTDWLVSAQEQYNFTVGVTSDGSKKLDGFIPTSANKCGGVNNFSSADMTSFLNYVTGQVGASGIIASQCWGDETPGEHDFNDYFVVWAYTPTQAVPSVQPSPSIKASPTPSIKASPSPSIKASPSPSIKASPSPSPSIKASPSPSIKASPTPSIKASPSPSPSIKASASVAASATPTPTPTPSPSIRAAAPTASELPEAGVFEVTAGTVGIGAVLIILGLLGLLIL